MPRKSKQQIEEEERQSNRLHWLFIFILSAVLIFFTKFTNNLFGTILNNFLVYLFGSYYLIPLLTLSLVGLYIFVFSNSHEVKIQVIISLYLINFVVLLFSAYKADNIINLVGVKNYLLNNFLNIFSKTPFLFSGGIINNLIYVGLTSIMSRTLILVLLIVLLVISIIILIPFKTYKNVLDNTSQRINNNRNERQKRKQEALILKQKAEEERKSRQAEEMALEDEKEYLKQNNVVDTNEEEVIVKKKHVDTYSTSSPFLINLTDSELQSGIKSSHTHIIKEKKPEIIETKKQRVLKPVTNTYSSYKLPFPYEMFLDKFSSSSSNINKTSASVKGQKVIEILANFGIKSTLVNTYIGPSVTKFEIKPDSSVKVNKINNISDNIKMELAAKDIRIEAPIPGKNAVGIEIPNVEPIPVKMLDLIKNIPNAFRKENLVFALGKDLMGKPIFCDVSKMPHLLIAGATGSGKSVCINSIITSLLLRTNPKDIKLVLVDPKKVEFTPYKDIPHLLWPIIDDPQIAANMLKRLVVLMEDRYDLFKNAGVRNIQSYNEYVDQYNAHIKDGQTSMARLPFICVIIDELADLMAIAGKDVELSIQRITQLARASGIHLIVATQRPSTDVITGLIKSNIPSRISFAVASSIDSRTILDQTGAERLLGNGDMLYYPQGVNAPIRLQGVYVTDKEINKITKFVKSQAKPEYEDSYFEFLTNMNGTTVMNANSVNADSMDSLYDDVVEFVKERKAASTSLLQRRFGIGYNRAARLIDTLEDKGLIGPANGSKPREVYIKDDDE